VSAPPAPHLHPNLILLVPIISPITGSQCGTSWAWEGAPSVVGNPAPTGPRAVGHSQPLQRKMLAGDQAVASASPAFQAAPNTDRPTNAIIERKLRQRDEARQHPADNGAQACPQAQLEVRPTQGQQPAAHHAQPQAPTPRLTISQDPLPPHVQGRAFVAFYTIEDGHFRYVRPPARPGANVQTAIDLTGEDNGGRAAGGRGSRE